MKSVHHMISKDKETSVWPNLLYLLPVHLQGRTWRTAGHSDWLDSFAHHTSERVHMFLRLSQLGRQGDWCFHFPPIETGWGLKST